MTLRYLIPLLLSAALPASAQTIITFRALEAQTSAPLTLDSVYVVHDASQRDTTLIGVTGIDLGVLSDASPVPVRPDALELGVPAPTVFTTRTEFDLRCAERGRVDIRVYAVDGRTVAAWSGTAEPAAYRFTLDGPALPAGIYFIAATTGSRTAVRKAFKSAGGGGSEAQLRLLSSRPWSADALHRSGAERWTFIGYARGHQPDTLAGVEAQGGTQYSFLMTPVPAGMKLTTGRMQPAGIWQVPPQGGSIVVDKPGSPVHGVSITVPDGAHGETRQYDLSTADITSHQLGGDVRILTPLIQVRNGGGYAGELITIRIPAAIPQDEFAMAFLYNEKSGEIEGLPLLEEDATGLTVVTRHFGTSSVTGSGFRKTTVDGWSGAVGNMFVASVKKSFLSGKSVISTGYSVGQDDWEFPNHGSYLAPRGHCAGQSVTSMWYYYEKKLRGAPPLYHRYDPEDAEAFWMDNPRGYKFCSVIQKDIRWDDWLHLKLWELCDSTHHELGWNALNMAMLLTGEPQYLGIFSTGGGHAIIAYRINVTDGTIAVADPNFPGQEREVVFRAPYFQPYSSKQNANEADPQAYTRIGYNAKTSMIDWEKITSRWAQFENGSIGTVAPNTFPEIVPLNKGTGEELTSSGITVSTDSLQIVARVAGIPVDSIHVYCYNSALRQVYTNGKICLEPGTEQYRFYFEGKKLDRYRFVDYRWVYVTNRPAKITDITPRKALRGQEITIAGSGFGDDRKKGEVTLNGRRMPDIVSWAENEIHVLLPADARSGPVVVRRDSSFSNKVSYTLGATISDVVPAHGYPGDTVRIHGTELGRVDFVRFNGQRSDVSSAGHISDTLIAVHLPGGCLGGTVELGIFFEDPVPWALPFVMDAPVITSISPSPLEGKQGTLVTITGEHLGGNDGSITPRLTIGGTEDYTFVSWTGNSISFYPRRSGQIVVTVCGQTWTGPVFTLLP